MSFNKIYIAVFIRKMDNKIDIDGDESSIPCLEKVKNSTSAIIKLHRI